MSVVKHLLTFSLQNEEWVIGQRGMKRLGRAMGNGAIGNGTWTKWAVGTVYILFSMYFAYK